MQLGLSDKVFVVTAASSGLGLATAHALVAEGARVVLVARRAEALAEACVELNGGDDAPDRAKSLAADLADPQVPQRAVDLALQTFGRVDGALVSVGGPPRGGVLDNTDEEWSSAFSSVFLPALRTARAVTSAQPAPRLAFVLSTSAKVPLAQMAISNGLRPGLAMLVKQLADELGPRGGRAVGLLPGSVATERLQHLWSGTPDPQAAREQAAVAIPLRRLGEPAEFGRVAAFLLSDAASYVTGCLVPVDGGAMRAL
ncbi:SDR family oxidoreductase [Aestuariimicrobium sp. T2.26MG-19.2B]|uniref:SDR family oxidoreductase n=1 Tax=Aestuariimicrobium sp. T2.26MG-19.2B TaxID=3040679 RepID=UPI002477A9BF|nr:SDR family oxidoreductase [Aestuariimicrobium sp. T2.26MG-19.2B]CAI9399086.1 putative oxidoreductase [Aestuariimicrobium sp. T2.26MG-19.2B]